VTPGKLGNFCDIHWDAFGVGWSSEWSLDKVIVDKDSIVVVGDPRHPDASLY
jgi:hypothetical protein